MLPNAFVTPHVAGAMGNELRRLSELAVVEVERFVFGPQATDDRAGFGEARYGVGGVVVGQTVCVVFAPRDRVAGS